MKLHYTKPARLWTEALPVGNGRLGAMIFGGVETERLQLNEDTLWSGGPKDGNNPQAKQVLPEVRRLLAQRRWAEADRRCKEMMGPYTQSYMPLGDLLIKFDHGAVASSYTRSLNLEEGLSRVEYRVGEVMYTRETLASFPDQVIAVRVQASQPAMLNLHARLESALRYRTSTADGQLIMRGIAPEHVEPNYVRADQPIVFGDPEITEAMRFEARLDAVLDGGSLQIDQDGMHIHGATAVTLLFSAATSFNGHDRSPGREGIDPGPMAADALARARRFTWDALRDRHMADHRALFDRVELRLGAAAAPPELPTDQRIAEYGAADPGLVELLFQYGRYLLIASSRPGTQPANLQGIWNQETRPPWSSNWTLNINAQMNYWPAEICNLAECHEPLLAFIGRLAQNGKKTAAVNYGARGWTAHHNSDIWAQSAPVGNYGRGDPVWALWPLAGAWLSQHLWEHYAFGQDAAFLRQQAYPVMREAALFCLDWLIEDENGYLITSPSTSPEHKFRAEDGSLCGVSVAATLDLMLIWDLFTNCIEASEVLGTDAAFRRQLAEARERLLPLQIGKYGQLQEWSRDFAEEDVHHRHVSPLFGVYPGRQLSEAQTPDLLAAAKRFLERRGDGGTGWSLGWKVGLWARFRDGDRALRLIANLLQLVKEDNTTYHQGDQGGVYANLFDSCPPFQIDGNFAATAGIAELLVQSHQQVIHLLPALPAAWPSGWVKGLRGRGGFEVSVRWEQGALVEAELLSLQGGLCAVRAAVRLTVRQDGVPVPVEVEEASGIVRFSTDSGGRYSLRGENGAGAPRQP